MSRRVCAVLSVMALGLSSCSTLTKESVIQDQIVHSNAAIPNTWLLPLQTDLSKPMAWAQIYDDPILLGYLRQAQSQNFDVRLARTRIQAADAALQRSQSQLWPAINASLSASGASLVSDFDTKSDSYSAGLSGSWNPDIFGETKENIKAARANLAIQNALGEDTRQRILAQTARAYIRAVEANSQVNLAKVNLEFLTEQRRISEARFRVGDTSKSDFSFAEANYQSALSGYENTKQAARTARRGLSVLLGDFPLEDLPLSDDLGQPLRLPPRALPAQVLENRPDIIGARAQIAARFAALRSAQAGDWPQVSITGGLAVGSEFKTLFDPSDYIARIGAALAGSVFDGGANAASQDAAQASLDGSVLSYEQTLRAAMQEISDAYDRSESFQRTLVHLEAASTAAHEALRLENIQYDLGESSLLDLLQVQTRVNNIDVSLLRTKASLLENTILAYESIGGF